MLYNNNRMNVREEEESKEGGGINDDDILAGMMASENVTVGVTTESGGADLNALPKMVVVEETSHG